MLRTEGFHTFWLDTGSTEPVCKSPEGFWYSDPVPVSVTESKFIKCPENTKRDVVVSVSEVIYFCGSKMGLL